MEKERDFSQLYKVIYDKFIKICSETDAPSGSLAFGKFLGHGHDGKIRAWKKGQWPSAEDCWTLEKKLGFDLRWLVTGEGNPFSDKNIVENVSLHPASPHFQSTATSSTNELERENTALRQENAELTVELRGALKEIRRLNEEKRELEERLKHMPERQDKRLDNPQHATSDRPASGVPERGM